MDTPYEIERDQAICDFIDETIEEFTLDRLRSYYLTYTSLALPTSVIYDGGYSSCRIKISGTHSLYNGN